MSSARMAAILSTDVCSWGNQGQYLLTEISYTSMNIRAWIIHCIRMGQWEDVFEIQLLIQDVIIKYHISSKSNLRLQHMPKGLASDNA